MTPEEGEAYEGRTRMGAHEALQYGIGGCLFILGFFVAPRGHVLAGLAMSSIGIALWFGGWLTAKRLELRSLLQVALTRGATIRQLIVRLEDEIALRTDQDDERAMSDRMWLATLESAITTQDAGHQRWYDSLTGRWWLPPRKPTTAPETTS